jgi:sialate O-acetylesterase
MSTYTRLAAAFLLAFAGIARADLRLPAVIGDHMVLQRESEVTFWGQADPGVVVEVLPSWKVGPASVRAGADGAWRVVLHTPQAGGPHTLRIRAGQDERVLTDVLVGEVWVCSGQSNMEWSIDASRPDSLALDPYLKGLEAEIPLLRLFDVERAVAAEPSADCKGAWKACSTESVRDFSAVAYWFGRAVQREVGVPVGLISTNWGGTLVEAWTSAKTLAGMPGIIEASSTPAELGPNSPSALYNGMIAPLVPFAIRGAIWYQGESNRPRAHQYRALFPALIADWREQWGRGDFPFYYVQIAPFAYENDAGEAAELREAQTLALRVPNTGMAVTMDVGNPTDIHPKDKRTVGERLARWALAKTYGKAEVVCSGPLYKTQKIEGGAIRLVFDHAQGLTAQGDTLARFTIAGENRKFVPAEARIDGETIVVSSASVPRPVAVRFAWGAADEARLLNAAGLPAPSFRTDTWPGLTER